MLVSFKTDVDAVTGEPLSAISASGLEELRRIGSDATTVDQAAADPKVLAYIADGMQRANKKAVSRAQNVQKFKVLPKDFSIAGGELGPTLKLKRHEVNKIYADLIESIYAEAAGAD
jgi:long-chain-fatty-acid--CoA ligase ACSBG